MVKMETLTYAEFKAFEKNDSYYKGRWPYFNEVIRIINKECPKSVLELGPYKNPIVKGSDVMDVNPYFPHVTYSHNAAEIPWPIEDSQYDLFIALQVWEHLNGKQSAAFKEVMRISKMAILSFPLNWFFPGDCHNRITEDTISEWTQHAIPFKKIKVTQKLFFFLDISKIIYFFKFR